MRLPMQVRVQLVLLFLLLPSRFVDAQSEPPPQFNVGSSLEVREGDVWSPAKVIEIEGRRTKVRYSDGTEEWVGKDRLRAVGMAGKVNEDENPFKLVEDTPKPTEPPQWPRLPFSTNVKPAQMPTSFGKLLRPDFSKVPNKSLDSRAVTFAPDAELDVKGKLFEGSILVGEVRQFGFEQLQVIPGIEKMMLVKPIHEPVGTRTTLSAYELPSGKSLFDLQLPQDVSLASVSLDQSLVCLLWTNPNTPFPSLAASKFEPGNSALSIWNLTGKGDVSRVVTIDPLGKPHKVILAQNDLLLVQFDERLCAYSIPEGKPLWQMPVGKASDLAFSRNRRQFAVRNNSAVTVVDAVRGEPVAQLVQGRGQFVLQKSLSFSPNGKELCELFGDMIRIWDLQSEKVVDEIPSYRQHRVVFVDSRFLLADSKLIDRKTQRIVWTYRNGPVATLDASWPLVRNHLWQWQAAPFGSTDSRVIVSNLLDDKVLQAANQLKKESVLAYQAPAPVSLSIRGLDAAQTKLATLAATQKLLTQKVRVMPTADVQCVIEVQDGSDAVVTIQSSRQVNGQVLQSMQQQTVKSKVIQFEMKTKKGETLSQQRWPISLSTVYLKEGQSVEKAVAELSMFKPDWLAVLYVPQQLVFPDKADGAGTTDLLAPQNRR